MTMIHRLSFFLALVVLTFSSSHAWTARSPLSFRGFSTTPRTPRFLDLAGTQSCSGRSPFPRNQNSNGAPRSKRWRRALVSFAGMALISTLLSPTAAWANTPETAPAFLPKAVPTMVELQLTIRLLVASLLGASVGKERSSTHKHSAGVRTMALVALGACAFTVCSSFGFSGKCDPSRMASNVASGVGFVGAGVITTTSANPNDSRQSIVHGLTTATAIWISAAIGVACGVGMLYIASAATLLTISILRFGGLKMKLKTATKSVEEKLHHGLFPTRTKHLPLDVPIIPLGGSNSTLSSTTASLEEMNQDDEWDSHVEIVISEDDPECQSEQIISHTDNQDPTVALPKEEMQRLRKILKIDPDITEFYIRGQATLLEQAQSVAQGNNLTELVTASSPQNSTFAEVTKEYSKPRGHGNTTMAP